MSIRAQMLGSTKADTYNVFVLILPPSQKCQIMSGSLTDKNPLLKKMYPTPNEMCLGHKVTTGAIRPRPLNQR